MDAGSSLLLKGEIMEMWIWISGWMACGVTGVVLAMASFRIKGETWSGADWVIGFFATFFGPLLMVAGIIALAINLSITRPGKGNKSIYWDDKQQQIKTKSGKCLYNRREVGDKFTKIFQRIETLSQKIRKLEQSKETKIENIREDWLKWQQKCNKVIEENMEVEKRLEAQLQCGVKGHNKWEFVKKDLCFEINSPEITGFFFFKCSNCGLEITKIEKELKPAEREALRKLKLL